MSASTPFSKSLAAIDAAHALDPNKITVNGEDVPYELHYAQKCTAYLEKREPDASEALRLAIRAQHFRRWEVPRNTYPMTRIGYHTWRTHLKKRQADLVASILDETYANETREDMNFIYRVASLMKKEGLREGDEEASVLEDVACLVFLDDQFEKYAKQWDEGKGEEGTDSVKLEEEKVIGILRKTWAKMTEKGHELALQIPMEGRPKELIQKALAG